MDDKKKKFTLEYPIKCTVASLYTKLSTDEGLESWFADQVTQENNQFTFYWHKIPQAAELIAQRENQYVRFRWVEEEDPEAYFEMRITPHELTRDIALSITDFSDPDEYEDSVQMWENNVKNLRLALGCR
jgi:hypothetical protein